MRDQQYGRAGGPPDLQQFVTHDQPRLRVERAKGLVEQDHARLHHQRPRDADALAHAARKLNRIGLGEIDQPHQPQRIVEPARDLRCLDAVAAQAEHDVVGDVEPGKGRILLEHDADALGHAAIERATFEQHLSAGRLRQAGEHVEQRRLPAAGRADHRIEFAPPQAQLGSGERVDAAGIDAGDAPHFGVEVVPGSLAHRTVHRARGGAHFR